MTTKVILLTALLLLAAPLLAAGRAFHAAVQDGGHAAAVRLGQFGGRLIRSAEQWEHARAALKAANVKTASDTLGPIDWLKEDVALTFHYGDEGDRFVLRALAGDGQRRDVDVAMSYVLYKQRRALTVGVWRCFAVPVPRAAATRLGVSTFPNPGAPDANPNPDKATLEWEFTFSDKAGDAIGGLAATIEPKAAAAKPGDDLAVRFTLLNDGAVKVADGQFARRPRAEYVPTVWDGKYSNGYRNHAFEVVTPDGKLRTLRPKEQLDWGKNAPHPVAVKPGQPYVLPDWADPAPFKSLKALGLDAAAPGVYTITGVYQQTARPNDPADMWTGTLRTNTIRVEVK